MEVKAKGCVGRTVEVRRSAGIGIETTRGSAHLRTARAVSRNRSSGNPTVFRVQADRFDHEIEFVGASDLARYAVGTPGRMSWALEKS